MATRRPTSRTRFGVSWTDDYAWLRDPAYPEVVDPEIRSYLEAENAWFERFMAPLRPQIASLHEELKARITADDSSVPVREGGFEYHWQFFVGAQYRTWFRRRLDGGALRHAASALIGQHDFSAFRSAECQALSPIKTAPNGK